MWQRHPLPKVYELGSDDKLIVTGAELWWGKPFILWDCTDENNVVRCRYCGWVAHNWNQNVLGAYRQFPLHGETFIVKETEDCDRNILALAESVRKGGMELGWYIRILGCYVPRGISIWV